MNPPRFLSLFSGIGLHDLGLECAGWEVAAQVEREPYCRAVLAKHWPHVPRFNDVRSFGAAEVAALGPIALVTGGFPCQDISLAGKARGLNGDRSGLWFEMLRIISMVTPDWVLAENVPAIYSRGIDDVLDGLETAGYAAWPVVVGAWAVGAPHRRDRVWIVGRRVAGAEGERLEGWTAGERSAPRSPVGRGSAEGSSGSVGDPNSARLEGAGTGAHEGRPGSGNGRSGVGDAQGLGRGEGQGREALAGVAAPGRRVPCRARQGGGGWPVEWGERSDGTLDWRPAGLADPAGGGLGAGERDDDAGEPDAPGRGEGMADAERDTLRQLQQWEPSGRLQRGVRDGGQAESGGLCEGDPGVAESDLQRLAIDSSIPSLPQSPRRPSSLGGCWPATRGQAQYEWEPPRLVESSVGRGVDGSPTGVDGSAGRDHKATLRIRAAARKERLYRSWVRGERLKAIGNANPPQVPEVIGRWLLQQGE